MTTALHLSGCTYTWLHQEPLDHALAALADLGFSTFELTTAVPHLFAGHFGTFARRDLVRRLGQLGLTPISVNPGFVDINVVSTNPELQRVSVNQMRAELELAHDLGAQFVVLIPGRAHQLTAPRPEVLEAALVDVLEELVPRAEALGVTLTLENSPYGFLGRSADQLAVVERFKSANLGLTYDVANAIAVEDPVEAVYKVQSRLRLVHVSDTWRDRWAHTSIGRGEVDFAAFGRGLQAIGWSGTTVYELADGEPPLPRLHDDLRRLAEAGWSPGANS